MAAKTASTSPARTRLAYHSADAHPLLERQRLGLDADQRGPVDGLDRLGGTLEAIRDLMDPARPSHEGEPATAAVKEVGGGEATSHHVVHGDRGDSCVGGAAVHEHHGDALLAQTGDRVRRIGRGHQQHARDALGLELLQVLALLSEDSSEFASVMVSPASSARASAPRATSVKNGFETSSTTSATVVDWPARSWRAAAFGT
ncbi:hypothetical protein GCM10025876_28190 [Demequina litorisediminis]|uniref:Uncharacterized protein n=1 Tax=Demequina litorisediminis TaxID=1849022 RepID=A0ABQ6IH21_9MICO|nr:hypothetical protein GCM10025876_28190 [Demequina litorisediminis]